MSVATVVFADRDYHDCAMNDIADAAGVTKPVLYQHFGSKRELYLELLGTIGDGLQAQITAAVASAISPRQQIEGGFRAYFDWVSSRPAEFRLLFGAGTRRDREFAAKVSKVERSLADSIAALIVIDGLDDERRRLLALGIVGMAEATCRNLAGERGGIDSGELADQVAELAWFGLRGIRGGTAA